jgi:hypothetical protein
MVLIFFGFVFILVACGGNGGVGDGPTTRMGKFLDSAVEGLSYVSGNQSGITDVEGNFTFEEGATVQFSIGDIIIGEATAKSIMTPVNLVSGAKDETDPTVINISRFLQTLDDDADLNNGITIIELVRNQAVGKSINFDQDVTTFENDANVLTIISDFTYLNDAGIRPLISIQDCQDHLRNTLLGIFAGTYSGTFSGNDSGTWTVTVDSEGNVTGSGVSTVYGINFDINVGTVTSSGEVTFVAGTVTIGATFSGTVSSTGEVSGTWVNEFYEYSGTFSGSLGAEDDNGGGMAVSTVTVTVQKNGTFAIDISGCAFTQSTSKVANIQYNDLSQQISFEWTVIPGNGNCAGQAYYVFVHDTQYNTLGQVTSAKYDYQGQTYIIYP